MYKKVNLNRNYLEVLSLFTRGFDREFYIREVNRLSGLSPRTAKIILDNLEKEGVLESKTRGKIRTFKLKRGIISRNYLVLAENYKRLKFTERKEVVRDILSEIDKHITGVGILFGSYAKEMERKGSDLDIFVVGQCNISEVDKLAEKYGIDINIKTYPEDSFIINLRTDHLIKEVLKDHIVFLNTERFISLVMENG